MTIQEESEELLVHHALLGEKLSKVPDSRELNYRVETLGGNRVGKPRFEEPLYAWSKDLYKDLRNHLQNLWIFFNTHSYWFDHSLRPILDYRKRRLSKKSIIFLLEREVWETDEVYGDYLIEKEQNSTIISYFRRDRKLSSKELNTIDDNDIEQWICIDAIRQIKDQFDFLWKVLNNEVQTVAEEDFQKTPKISLSIDYLKEQFEKIKESVGHWPESALLNLGRVIEIWLLIELNCSNSRGFWFLIRQVYVQGLIDKSQASLLENIRREYNKLKHHHQHTIDEKLIKTLVKDFEDVFYSL